MALILHIDTALTQASVGISRNGELLQSLQHTTAYNHAAFVQPAIQQLLQQLHLQATQLDAIGVVAGPGSYTGLRVGMATAKGLCYALQKPLLAINTLQLMAAGATREMPGFDAYGVMIDARRNEVYTAVYSASGEELMSPNALILNESSYTNVCVNLRTLFSGDGTSKAKIILNNNPCWSYVDCSYKPQDIGKMLFNAFINRQFGNLAYLEPFYLKEFYFATTPH